MLTPLEFSKNSNSRLVESGCTGDVLSTLIKLDPVNRHLWTPNVTTSVRLNSSLDGMQKKYSFVLGT
jgi:hypothetical protein